MLTTTSSHRSFGFYNAPVSKFVLFSLIVAYALACWPVLAQWRHHLSEVAGVGQARWQVWLVGVLVSRVVATDVSQLLFVAILTHHFRWLERLSGSRQFASQLAVVWSLSTAGELALQLLARRVSNSWPADRQLLLSSGPYGLLLPLFVDFYAELPALGRASVCGVALSDKWITYSVGLQLCLALDHCCLATASALIAGICYCGNVGQVRRLVWPGPLCRWLGGPLLRLLQPPPSPSDRQLGEEEEEELLGATPEIQRQQFMDRLEMMALSAARRAGQSAEGEDVAGHLMHRPHSSHDGAAEPSVRQLMDMGFTRQRAETALRSCNNDVNMAATLLLQR